MRLRILLGKLKNEMLYLSCVLCGMSKPGKVIPRYFNTPPLRWMAIEVRENRGGRGVGGFFLRDGYTLKEALESGDPRVRELAELQLKKLCEVLRAYLKEGILSIDDLMAEE